MKARVVTSFSYAVIAYKCAWLSLYHAEEFLCACISMKKDIEDIVSCLNSFKKRGIQVRPPSINKSTTSFSIYNDLHDKKVVYGLSSIKGIGKKVTDIIVGEREANGKYKSIEDFINRLVINKSQYVIDNITPDKNGVITAPIDKGQVNALIEAGAFDELDNNRYRLLNLYNAQIKKDKNWVLLDEKEYEIKRKYKLELDKKTMGSYISEHPLDTFPYVDFEHLEDGADILFAGHIISKSSKKSAKGTNYQQVKANVKDGIAGERDIICNFFRRKNKPNEYAKYCKEGTIVVFHGTWSKQWSNVSVYKVETLVGVNNADVTLDNVEQAKTPPNYDKNEFGQEDLNQIFSF